MCVRACVCVCVCVHARIDIEKVNVCRYVDIWIHTKSIPQVQTVNLRNDVPKYWITNSKGDAIFTPEADSSVSVLVVLSSNKASSSNLSLPSSNTLRYLYILL